MREILFRGKAKCGLRAGEFIHGYYVKDFWLPTRTGHGILPLAKEKGGYYEVYPETVGQFTGLTDKNGKRIFEGDIIYMGLFPFVIKYDVENARYMLFNSRGGKRDGFNAFTMETHEVIGNIHDNPELLK